MRVFLLWFCGALCASSSSLGFYARCPSGCQCFPPSRTVRCASRGLSAVPHAIPGYATNLFFVGNTVRKIRPESFVGLDNVTSLVLSNNGITELSSHTFSSLTMLRSLNLDGNQLVLIHPEAFWVPGSPIQDLHLSGSLYNHTSLMDLITALRWGGLGNLLHLDLSGNHILLLPPGLFSPLPNLRQLCLANNSLVAVYNSTFSGVERLELLDLTGNTFTSFSTEGLHQLERLARARLLLGRNPYLCTCGMEQFAAWVNSSRVRVGDLDGLLCASPPQMNHITVRSLTASVLGCHGNILSEVGEMGLHTSYVFLGLVCGLVGMVFLLVLYLNRKGINKYITDIREACRDILEGYQYRYEIDSDPRIRHVGTNSQQGRISKSNHQQQSPADVSTNQIPTTISL
ncbi:trophoblast glycoprotein-like [Denticeps clupeoides]|uniref:Trophoblast glycoprotein-like n=1 Tax=Denticeps clupeoides TaxID=299321 RepID=A0AAY4AB42_9TELE|nr:trophoblast glycoprotein-like [Denticeps clupeoides]